MSHCVLSFFRQYTIFLGGTSNETRSADLQMVADPALVAEGQQEQTLPDARHDLVVSRRRGPDTDLPATPEGALTCADRLADRR